MMLLARTAGPCRRLLCSGLLGVSLLSVSASASPSWAGAQSLDPPHARVSRENLIKAAIVYNLAKFARWPDSAFRSPDAPFQFCVLGGESFGGALATIEGKRVHSRPLRTSLITEPEAASDCHLLFVGTTRQEPLDLLQNLADQPILTVGEAPGFARAGGVIHLAVVDERNQFDVNVGAARRAGLELSAKLLRLARSVIGR